VADGLDGAGVPDYRLLVSRNRELPVRRLVTAALNRFFALTIGMMAFGHLLAVSAKLVVGTLEGSIVRLYAIGILLALPSWWLLIHTRELLTTDRRRSRTTLLNVWTGLTLLALGLHNLPLAAPALLNIGYQLHSRRGVGWALVSLAILAHLGLFVASLAFLASGKSFEQFRAMG
jgi:hypothetical protein